MHVPLELEIHTSWHREALLREAEAERLAQAATSASPPRLRTRLAAALYALALRLDPSATIPVIDRARVEARSA
jgi:hypothetical protein